jgi:tetratricopeptide (TPR) repeat protein
VAYASFERAAALLPRAEYFVGQGEALRRDSRGVADVIGRLQSLADQGLATDPELAGAWGLKGSALVLAARTQADQERKKQLLETALEAYDKAIARSEAGSEDRYMQLIGRSTAHVESAFLEGEDATKLDQLTDAAADAQAATQIEGTPEPESGWNAWGNAQEDIAYYLRKTEYYDRAIDKFVRAAREAAAVGRSQAASYVNLGRCRFRSAVDHSVEGTDRSGELSQSLIDLESAVEESQQRHKMFGEARDGRAEAEANYWISRTLEAQGDLTSAEDAATRSAQLAQEYDPVNWPKYQIEAASLALNAGHPARAKRRATGLLQSELGAEMDRDLLFRAMVLVLATTDTLAERVQLSTDYLEKLSGDNASFVANRLQLLLWRSEQIASSRDASAGKLLRLAENDAQEVVRRARELGKAASVPFRARALFVLGTINWARSNELEIKNDPHKGQQTALRACQQLKEAIPLLRRDPRNITARIAFAQSAMSLMSTHPTLKIEIRRQLKKDAEAFLRHLVLSETIDKNSRSFQNAQQLFRRFRDYRIDGP